MPRTLKELFIELKDDITERILDTPRVFRNFKDFLKRVKLIVKAFPKMKRRKKVAALLDVGIWYNETKEDISRHHRMLKNRIFYFRRRALLIIFPDYYMFLSYVQMWIHFILIYFWKNLNKFLIHLFYQTIVKIFILPLLLLFRKIRRMIHKLLYKLLLYDYKKNGYFRQRLFKIFKLII